MKLKKRLKYINLTKTLYKVASKEIQGKLANVHENDQVLWECF